MAATLTEAPPTWDEIQADPRFTALSGGDKLGILDQWNADVQQHLGDAYEQDRAEPFLNEQRQKIAAEGQGPISTAARSFMTDAGQVATGSLQGLGTFGNDAAAGIDQLTGFPGAGSAVVNQLIPGMAAYRAAVPYAEAAQQGIEDFYQPDRQLNPISATIGGGAGQAVAMLPSMIAGPVGPLALGAMQGYQQGAEQATDLGIQNPFGRMALGAGFAGAEMFTERLGGIGSGPLKEGAQQMINRIAGKGLQTIASEAIEEPITGVAQDAMSLGAGYLAGTPQAKLDPLMPTAPGYLERRAMEALGGAVGGAVSVGAIKMLPAKRKTDTDGTPPPLPRPNGAISREEIEQAARARLAQLERDERGQVLDPEFDYRDIPFKGRALTAAEQSEKYFLQSALANPNGLEHEKLATAYGFDLKQPGTDLPTGNEGASDEEFANVETSVRPAPPNFASANTGPSSTAAPPPSSSALASEDVGRSTPPTGTNQPKTLAELAASGAADKAFRKSVAREERVQKQQELDQLEAIVRAAFMNAVPPDEVAAMESRIKDLRKELSDDLTTGTNQESEISNQAPVPSIDNIGTKFAPPQVRAVPVIPDSPLGKGDSLDFLNENPIALSRSDTGGELDWQEKAGIPRYYRPFIASETGRSIDKVAEAAYEANLIKQPTADALMARVNEDINARRLYRVEGRKQTRDMLAREKQEVSFDKSQNKLERQAGAKEIPTDILRQGDQLIIDGEEVEVVEALSDEQGFATKIKLKDGDRFGDQEFNPQTKTGLFVDEFQPRPRAEGSSEGPFSKAGPQRGLGRGLGALLGTPPPAPAAGLTQPGQPATPAAMATKRGAAQSDNSASPGGLTEADAKRLQTSKIIDADGNPLLLHHGGDSKIVEWKQSQRGQLGAAYFTDSKRVALRYAIGGGVSQQSTAKLLKAAKAAAPNRKPVITRAFLDIKNPLDFTSWRAPTIANVIEQVGAKRLLSILRLDASTSYGRLEDKFQDSRDDEDQSFAEWLEENPDAAESEFSDWFVENDSDSLRDTPILAFLAGLHSSKDRKSLLDIFMDGGGYDGIVYNDAEAGGRTFVVREPSQIIVVKEDSFDSSAPALGADQPLRLSRTLIDQVRALLPAAQRPVGMEEMLSRAENILNGDTNLEVRQTDPTTVPQALQLILSGANPTAIVNRWAEHRNQAVMGQTNAPTPFTEAAATNASTPRDSVMSAYAQLDRTGQGYVRIPDLARASGLPMADVREVLIDLSDRGAAYLTPADEPRNIPPADRSMLVVGPSGPSLYVTMTEQRNASRGAPRPPVPMTAKVSTTLVSGSGMDRLRNRITEAVKAVQDLWQVALPGNTRSLMFAAYPFSGDRVNGDIDHQTFEIRIKDQDSRVKTHGAVYHELGHAFHFIANRALGRNTHDNRIIQPLLNFLRTTKSGATLELAAADVQSTIDGRLRTIAKQQKALARWQADPRPTTQKGPAPVVPNEWVLDEEEEFTLYLQEPHEQFARAVHAATLYLTGEPINAHADPGWEKLMAFDEAETQRILQHVRAVFVQHLPAASAANAQLRPGGLPLFAGLEGNATDPNNLGSTNGSPGQAPGPEARATSQGAPESATVDDAAYLAAVEAGDMETAQRMVDAAAKAFIESFPKSDNENDVPNLGSISADGGDFTQLGIREVPTGLFSGKGRWAFYDANDHKKVDRLLPSILNEGVRSPLIVVIDGHADGVAYVMEGAHRLAAIEEAKLLSFPALVLYDEGSEAVTRDEQGNVIPLSQRFNTADKRITRSQSAPPLKPSQAPGPKARATSQGAPESATLTQDRAAPVRSDLLNGEAELRYADVESRLKLGLAQAGLNGQGTGGLVSPESANAQTYASAGRPVPAYTEQASLNDIFAEEAKLIQRAQAEGFFWDQARVAQVLTAAVEKSGGTEHDVFILGSSPNKLVVKSTIKDSYGFAFRSPAQYLQRLTDYNAAFPDTQMRMIGVSQNSRGNGVIWTVQPFVEGKQFSSDKALQTELEKRGWQRIDKDYDENIIYRHTATGVVMRDAHKGNVVAKGKELFPIDVIVSPAPTRSQSQSAPPLKPSRAVPLREEFGGAFPGHVAFTNKAMTAWAEQTAAGMTAAQIETAAATGRYDHVQLPYILTQGLLKSEREVRTAKTQAERTRAQATLGRLRDQLNPQNSDAGQALVAQKLALAPMRKMMPSLAVDEAVEKGQTAVIDPAVGGSVQPAVKGLQDLTNQASAEATDELASELDAEDLDLEPEPSTPAEQSRADEEMIRLRQQLTASRNTMDVLTATWQKILESIASVGASKGALMKSMKARAAAIRAARANSASAAANRVQSRGAPAVGIAAPSLPVTAMEDGFLILIEQGIDSANWRAAMTKILGPQFAGQLDTLYAQSLGMYQQAMGAEAAAINQRVKAKATKQGTGKQGPAAKVISARFPNLSKMLSQLRPMIAPGLNWKQIFTSTATQQRQWELDTYAAIRQHPALQNLNAEQAKNLTRELSKAWQTKRRTVWKRELNRTLIAAGMAKPKIRAKIEASAPRLLALINLGALDARTFRDAVAKEFGLKSMNDAVVGKIKEAAEKLQGLAPGTVPYRKAAQKFMEGLESLTNLSRAQLLESWWTASVLSGWRTQMDILFGVSNAMEDIGIGAVVGAIRTGNYGVASRAIFATIERAIQAVPEAFQMVVTGNRSLQASFDAEIRAHLEEGYPMMGQAGRQLMAKGGWRTGFGAFQVAMGRIMSALDHITSSGSRAGALWLARANHPEIFAAAVNITAQDRANARKQALQILTGGTEPTTTQLKQEVKRYTQELLDARHTLPEIEQQASDVGLQSSLQSDPTGLGFLAYELLRAVPQKMDTLADRAAKDNWVPTAVKLLRMGGQFSRVLFGTKFIRTAGNAITRATNYVPGIGALNLMDGRSKIGSPAGDIILGKQMLGFVLFSGLLYAFRDREEDDDMGIEGGWKNLNADQRGQLLNQGKQPYSVWYRDAKGRIVSINYQQWSVANLLAAVGFTQDQRRYHGVDADAATVAQGLGYGLMTIADKAQLQGINTILGRDNNRSSGADTVNGLNKWAAGLVGGMSPRLVKDIEDVIKPQLPRSDYWWQAWAREVPILRSQSSGARVDIFGREITIDRKPLSRIYQTGTVEPEYQILAKLNQRDVWISDPTTHPRKVKLSTGSRDMLPLEKDRYAREAGKMTKDWLLQTGPQLLQMEPEQAQKMISQRTELIRAMALNRAVRR